MLVLLCHGPTINRRGRGAESDDYGRLFGTCWVLTSSLAPNILHTDIEPRPVVTFSAATAREQQERTVSERILAGGGHLGIDLPISKAACPTQLQWLGCVLGSAIGIVAGDGQSPAVQAR